MKNESNSIQYLTNRQFIQIMIYRYNYGKGKYNARHTVLKLLLIRIANDWNFKDIHASSSPPTTQLRDVFFYIKTRPLLIVYRIKYVT